MEQLTYICSLGIIALLNGVTDCPPPMPPIHEIPLLITNYYPPDEHGNWIPWNYQADDSPQHTGTGERLEFYMDGMVGACIGEWTTIGWSTAVSFWMGEERITVLCMDEFGAKGYRAPFYHPRLETWVICVDIFTKEPTYQLVESWSTSNVNVGEFLSQLK